MTCRRPVLLYGFVFTAWTAVALADETDLITALDERNATALVKAKAKDGYLELNGLRTLDPDVARVLSRFNGALSLDGLRELSPEVARAFSDHNGPLSFGGVLEIDEEAAKALAGNRGPIGLNSVTQLSPEAAAHFARHPYGLGLGSVVVDAPSLASALATHQGDIAIAAIPSTGRITEEFASHPGALITRRGLESMDPANAAALAKHAGPLVFGSGEIRSVDVANALKQHRNALIFDGPLDIPEDVQTALADTSAYLDMAKLVSLQSEALARKLAHQRHPLQEHGTLKRRRLELTGLKTVSPAAAAALAEFDGDELWLGNPARFSDEALACLSRHVGSLSFFAEHTGRRPGGGFTYKEPLSFTRSGAAAIAAHDGDLAFLGPLTLSDEAQNELAASQHKLSMHGLTLLTSARLAGKLASQENSLVLCDLESLTLPIAQVLARHKGYLNVGIHELDGHIATALAMHGRGGSDLLALDNVKSLSGDAAKALLAHSGPVRLSGLKAMTVEARKILRAEIESGKFVVPDSVK